MINVIVVAIVLVAVGAAARYVIKAKKRGIKCIGCPEGHQCRGCTGCH